MTHTHSTLCIVEKKLRREGRKHEASQDYIIEKDVTTTIDFLYRIALPFYNVTIGIDQSPGYTIIDGQRLLYRSLTGIRVRPYTERI
jgi:hypothetical protein